MSFRLSASCKAIKGGAAGWALLLWMLLTGVAPAADRGPLAAVNRFPLHLIFLSPRPVAAELPEQGTLGVELAVDYSSVYFDEHSDPYDFLVDMETMVTELSLAYTLTERLGLRLQVPLVSMNSGFLDHLLAGYHEALGVSNYGREDRPADSFAYRMAHNGASWVEGSSGAFGWADITVSAQWLVFRPTGARIWQSSILASLKAPTGNPDYGYGSGRWDAGLFLPTQWSFQRWSLHLMPGFICHDDPETLGAEIRSRNSYSLFGGAAYAHNDRWIWLAQLSYFSSPIEDTGVARIDDGAIELAFGFRRIMNRNWRMEFAFAEDPFTLAAPDFTIHLGLVWSSSR